MSATAPPIFDVIDARTLEILESRQDAISTRRRGWLIRRMLLVSDLLGLSLAFVAAELIYTHHTQGDVVTALGEVMLFAISLPIWVVVAKLYGLYDHDEERTDHSTADDFSGVFHLVTIGSWTLLAGAYLTQLAHPQLPKVLVFWLLAVFMVPLARSFARSRGRRSIHYIQNTIIVGAGAVGQQVARKLLRHPEYGINLVGFIDENPRVRREDIGHLALLGSLDDLPDLVGLLDIERVIISFSNEPDSELLALVRRLNELNVQVDIVSRFYEIVSASVDIHSVEGVSLMGLRPPRLSASSALLKRGMDVVASTLGLIVLSPVFLAIAIAIKVDTHGPVFFRQVRVGAEGRRFKIWKFRTMSEDAESRKDDVIHLNKHIRNGDDTRMFKMLDDPRVTRVGKFLRRTSLDELPQLINVFADEMSLVGPRPLILDEDRHVREWARKRIDLKPGMTGLWQVLGRSDIPFDEMVSLDYRYVSTWSMASDLNLLAKTVPAVLRSRNS